MSILRAKNRAKGSGSRTQRFVGVDACASRLKIVQCYSRGATDAWRVADLENHLGEGDRPTSEQRKLKNALGRQGIARGNAVCAITSPAVDVFPLDIKPAEPEAFEGLVVAQARDQLSYPLNEAILDYAVLPAETRRSGDESTPVIAFSIPRVLVEEIVQSIDGLGLTVDRLVTPACAVAPRIHAAEPGARYLLITTAESATSVSVVQDGAVLIERILPWSVRALVERLERELELPEAQCRALLMEPSQEGSPPEQTAEPQAEEPIAGVLRQILGPLYQELAQEADGCMGYCNSFLRHQAVAATVLAGPLTGHRPLREMLQKALGLPLLEIRAAFSLPGWEDPAQAASYAVAASCALWTEKEAS